MVFTKEWYKEHKHPLLGKHTWKFKRHPMLGKHRLGVMLGKHHSIETKEKMRIKRLDWHKKHEHPMYRKHHSEETKRKISQNKERSLKISKKLKGIKKPHLTKRNLENNPMNNLEVRKKVSENMKEQHKDPNSIYNNKEWKEKRLKDSLKRKFKRPTHLEKKFIKFFNEYNLPFSYVGNGSLLIDFKNPDFVESNGKKICLEVANKEEKSIKRKNRKFMYNSWQEYEEKRTYHFIKNGWMCLVLWDEELKNEKKLLDKIQNFIGEKID